jgi:hypothetical protein
MTRTARIVAVLALVGLAAALQASETASAGGSSVKVFVNEVEVTGLTNQEFKNCSVKFDAEGNVNISAPGYKIKRLDSGASDEGSKVWDSYSLIVNGSVVKKFDSSEGVILENITKHFSKGSNQIVITAAKKDTYPGGSKSNWFRIIIGEGHEEAKQIVIDKTLGTLTRKGSDTDPGSKTITVEAK